MSHRLALVYIALVSLPLVVFGWLGARTMAYERGHLEQQVGKLADDQLSEWNDAIATTLDGMALSVESTHWETSNHSSLRSQIRKDGRVRQFFVLGTDGKFEFPPTQSAMTQSERDFFERTRAVWESGAITWQPSIPKGLSPSQMSNALIIINPNDQQGKWHPWYWANGLHLMYWWPTESGEIHGVEWDRTRLIADLIGILPDTSLREDEEALGVKWIGATGQVLYQWGDVPEDDETLVTARALPQPFGAWSFKAYMDIYGTSQPLRIWYLGTSLTAVVLVFLTLGVYFYRENGRELREATQRISFVNHVSHELKTPLTNIRLYAELLQNDSDEAAAPTRKRLSIILSESERLSRLINNVLAFNRNRASKLKLNPKLGCVDDTLRHVIDQFTPTLAQHEIDVRFDGNCPEECQFDSDVLEQIVGNLLSNVEKYARSASKVTVQSDMENDSIHVVVQDDGPGISERDRDAIFEPFHRVDTSPNTGIAGTGIGLSIARDLARLHGGTLTLESCDVGARFCLRLKIEPGAIT